ncbi:MAG: NADH-quinone oxidoreductase subunit J [Phycisphaerales bacterium]|nr:NADH-quinone oxidoreductase subunit J [Phycisphaerales bacterium]
MDALLDVINPVVLYAGVVLGGIGVCLALPRRGVNPQPIGALLAAIAGAVILIGLGWMDDTALPNIYFYLFSFIALGACLRVISHPKPVYAALYFIMAVLASAGLYLLLAAEFMAFALIIVYAGAILITYLFVIMLATLPAEEDADEELEAYDRLAHEPVLASTAGFVLLAILTTMLFHGTSPSGGALHGPDHIVADARLADLPGKIERLMPEAAPSDGRDVVIDPERRVVHVEGRDESIPFPEDLHVANVEEVGFSLLEGHPGSIEIAGIILLMAMLGATVLARRQVDIDEDVKARAARRLMEEG